jgi:hypothetical protein
LPPDRLKIAQQDLLISVNTDNMLSLNVVAVRMNLSYSTAMLISQLEVEG